MKHYSPSQINQYLRCPAQWAYRYVHGLKIPPTSSLVQGTSYHKAMEVNLSQKIESRTDLPLDDVTDAYGTAFEEKIQEVEWNQEEKSIGIDKVKGGLKDEGIKITEIAHKTFNPTIQPKEVESPFKIHFANTDYTLDGVVDVVDETNIVIDHKTTAKTPTAISSQELIQAAVYSIAKETNQVVFNYAVKNKTPKTVSLTKEIQDADRLHLLKLMMAIDESINSKSFYPNRASMMCSRKHCGYWMECEKDWQGRVRD